ncbi:MAG: carbamoyltransferase HypF [Verrucomicrobiae bacterium]|nr:carbamoyltransferase HypF [Verrucomicrobiae bacterium]
MNSVPPSPHAERMEFEIRGMVQGVGFRPFVHQLGVGMGLSGWVRNTPRGVRIVVEGGTEPLGTFQSRLRPEAPPGSWIEDIEVRRTAASGLRGFEILESEVSGSPDTSVPVDLAVCADCVREVLDPANRRYRHPFTNCTRCGPRFTIIERMPYDRERTSMKCFAMCAPCRSEFFDPADRRFHAQPNACPDCGPRLALWSPEGAVLSTGDDALREAAAALRRGRIVAVKGLGGFQLLVTADQPEAVARLRERKQREEKPFAVMLADLKAVRSWCRIRPLEARLLSGPEAPIVLLRRHADTPGLEGVAPGNPLLGVLLPCTALHHLLLREVGGPVVATSGNRHDEPICGDEHQALDRLAGMADQFLVHDRPMIRALDDSVVTVVAGRALVLRRARGFVPRPIPLPPPDAPEGRRTAATLLAVGGHLKNTVALAVNGRAFLSQHIGDLETAASLEAHHQMIEDLQQLQGATASVAVTDAHPEYASTRAARASGGPTIAVQHHHAHLLSCLADNRMGPPAFGVIWDGSGDGRDGTLWGGEFLIVREVGLGFERIGTLRPFRLPGGEAAIREPRRAALGLLHALLGDRLWTLGDLPALEAFTRPEQATLRQMLNRGVQSPWTSSVGRLLDAVASLTGLRQRSRFEGQAAMELEFAAESAPRNAGRSPGLAWVPNPAAPGEAAGNRARLVLDWGPFVLELIEAHRGGVPARIQSRRLHEALADAAVAAAVRVGLERVVLSGGCFQNRLLTRLAVRRLRHAGLRPVWHRQVPPNDGGLALGQLMAASGTTANDSNEPCASLFQDRS